MDTVIFFVKFRVSTMDKETMIRRCFDARLRADGKIQKLAEFQSESKHTFPYGK